MIGWLQKEARLDGAQSQSASAIRDSISIDDDDDDDAMEVDSHEHDWRLADLAAAMAQQATFSRLPAGHYPILNTIGGFTAPVPTSIHCSTLSHRCFMCG